MSDSASGSPAPETPPPALPLGPVSGTERIDAIDILRGLALFGILTANMRGFFAPEPAYFVPGLWFKGTADTVAQGFVNYLVQGKFITLFAFLFGLGFAVQVTRAQERGRSIAFYARRLGLLAVFGIVHALFIWWGDVLLAYATIGFLLLLFRKRKPKTVAIWAVSLAAIPLVMMTGFFIAAQFGVAPPDFFGANDPEKLEKEIRAAIANYRSGSQVVRFRQNLSDLAAAMAPAPFFGPLFILPRFLAGLWVWRKGVFQNLPAFESQIRRVQRISGAVGLTTTLFAAALQFGFGRQTTFNAVSYSRNMLDQFAVIGLAVFYACSVLLLCLSRKWRPRLTPFGSVGRMALTNYLTQSLVLTWFFYLTGLYGRIGPAIGLLITPAFFAAQVWFSNWWLARYNFGPAEWLWRALTYGTRPAMRRVIETPVGAAAAEA